MRVARNCEIFLKKKFSIKLPAAVGQKKTKGIEQLLNKLNIDLHLMPTEENTINVYLFNCLVSLLLRETVVAFIQPIKTLICSVIDFIPISNTAIKALAES